MGSCESNVTQCNDEIWIIGNEGVTTQQEDKTCEKSKAIIIKASLRTLNNTKYLRERRKVYLSHCCDNDIIQPIANFYNVCSVKAEEGIFNGLLALSQSNVTNSSSVNSCKDNSNYAKIKCDNSKDLIYLLLIGDVPLNPEMQLDSGDSCRCGYYRNEEERGMNDIALSGTVLRRSYINLIVKSFSKIEESDRTIKNLIHCLYNISIGRTGLQPVIKFKNEITDFQKEIELLESQREQVTLKYSKKSNMNC